MKNRKLTKIMLALAIAFASASGFSTFASAPVAVSEMSKKELKQHERDIKNYVFETQVDKDRRTSIAWMKSPEYHEPLTPSISQYFRVGFSKGKLISIQLIVNYSKYDMGVYDKNTMDFKKFKLGTRDLSTAPQPGTVTGANAVILTTSVSINKYDLENNKDKGLLLKGISASESIDVPVRAAQVTGILRSIEKYEAKLAKKKKK